MKYKPVVAAAKMKNVRIITGSVKGISFAISCIKRDKGDGGAISARPVKGLTVQQRELHTIDFTSLVWIFMRQFK